MFTTVEATKERPTEYRSASETIVGIPENDGAKAFELLKRKLVGGSVKRLELNELIYLGQLEFTS